MAAKEYTTHAQGKAHAIQQYQQEAVLGKIQHMFQTTPEGVTQLEEIRTAWGMINTHTVGEEQALTKLHTATKK